MKEYLHFQEQDLHMTFGVTEEGFIRLLHFGRRPYDPAEDENFGSENETLYLRDGYVFSQALLSGYDRPYEKQGNMYICTVPGATMKYVSHTTEETEEGKLLCILQEDDVTKCSLITRFQFHRGLSCVHVTNEIRNTGSETQTLEYLGSFSYLGIDRGGITDVDHKLRISIPHHGWQKELAWRTYSLPEMGLAQNQPHVMRRTSKNIEFSNTGNWSSKNYLPMALIENLETDEGLFFEIEHNGSWHWEIGEQDNHMYLNISGPTEIQSHFSKNLKPGESFTSVPVCVGVSHADFSEAMSVLTCVRRRIRRVNRDNEELPVIFNDYMNCLFGDPTQENEPPLIEAAAKAGCEYYVIDAGWYASGSWWDGVGEWKESRERFPDGLRALTDKIRANGMIPGLWLELEVMGIHCPLADQLPDSWFFTRHGKRVFDRSRYQLDFRNPEVRAFATSVVDRLVEEYGAGYIKMDYNIEPGIGPEWDADSPGQGLLEHERAYIRWLEDIFRKYPDLVIENCSSGGMRMDYAMLSRYSIQSTSDQEDFQTYSTIACNGPSGVTPEQSAVWSYPMRDADRETVIFNMINAMMGRIHQSGHLAELSEEAYGLVCEGIRTYQGYRKRLPSCLPLWPDGYAKEEDPWVALALRDGEEAYLAVWRRETSFGSGDSVHTLDLHRLWDETATDWTMEVLYPSGAEKETEARLDEKGKLTLRFSKAPMARLFRICRNRKAGYQP
ncbi:MAG: alpha-galactosidase [Clostridia bacterium]|nr:alpha-galactosidase [Clostridia bacterium]